MSRHTVSPIGSLYPAAYDIASLTAFPAQHTSAPGLITVTPNEFFFTPIMSANAKIVIPFDSLRGVKKTGMLKGLSLRWSEGTQEAEREERFRWVGGRDELFARLIGVDGKRWIKA
jgi:GRAM domain-containing protein 4